jgi:hypothetical protein
MDIRDVRKARQRHERQFAQETVVFNGDTVALNGTTAVIGVPNHVYVQPWEGGDPFAVFNRNVKANRPRVAVQVGFAPYSSVLEILRTVIDTSYLIEAIEGLDVGPHAGSHRVDGDDPLFVEERAILSLLTYPTGQEAIEVHVSNYGYWADSGVWQVFPGYQNFSLAAYQPGSGSLLALVYLDLTTNTLGVAVGETIAQDTLAIIPPPPGLPATPGSATPSAFVRLRASATEIGWGEIFGARDILSTSGRLLTLRQDMIELLASQENEFDLALTAHAVNGW